VKLQTHGKHAKNEARRMKIHKNTKETSRSKTEMQKKRDEACPNSFPLLLLKRFMTLRTPNIEFRPIYCNPYGGMDQSHYISRHVLDPFDRPAATQISSYLGGCIPVGD